MKMKNQFANLIRLNLIKISSNKVAEDFENMFNLYINNFQLLTGDSLDSKSSIIFFAAQNIDIKSISSKFLSLNEDEQVDLLSRAYLKSFNSKQRYLTWTINKDVSITFDIVKRDVTILDCETIIQMSLNKFKNEIYSILSKDFSQLSRFNRIEVKDIEDKTRSVIISVRFEDGTKRIRFADASPVLTEQNMNELNEIMKIIA